MSDLRITEGFVPVPNGQLRYQASGDGAEVVVLIHGNAGDHRHWDAQVPALAKRMRVIRYDVRGFGGSSVPVAGAGYSDYDDLRALLDELQVAAAHVVGWSMGAGIAIDFALAHPKRAKSLAAVGPWLNGHRSEAVSTFVGELGAVARAFRQDGPTAAVEAWMAGPAFAASVQDPAAGAAFRRIAQDYSWWAMGNRSPQQPLSPSAAQRLAEVTAPTLILTAQADIPACLEVAELLATAISGARKVVMPGTGHLLHMEAPAAFNQHLLDFLQGMTATG